jgi:hypothetical protein
MADTNDLRSKLADGLLAAGVMIMLELLLILLIQPIAQSFSRPGILVYAVALTAVTSICLERSWTIRDSDITHAWMGIFGGLVGWVVVELSSWLGGLDLTGQTSILNLLLVFLVVSVLWRRVGTVGLRYFCVLFLMGWIGHVALSLLTFLTSLVPLLSANFFVLGYIAGAVGIGAVVYIFVRSQTQMERLNAAIVMWYAAMMMVYVFRGGFI